MNIKTTPNLRRLRNMSEAAAKAEKLVKVSFGFCIITVGLATYISLTLHDINWPVVGIDFITAIGALYTAAKANRV